MGWILSLAVLAVVAGVFVLRIRQVERSEAEKEPPQVALNEPSDDARGSETKPTPQRLNTTAAPNETPQNMAWVPGGSFWMGSNEFPDARPEHLIYVDGFWLDTYEVTNAQFASFVEATGYQTIAERPLDPEEFPDVPKEDLKPGSIVFTPPQVAVPLDNHLAWWQYVPGANWRHPEGPDSTITGRENHPVVQIAWHDAVAYAQWAGKRLPTEAEWELAARGGLDRQRYCWGGDLRDGTRWQSNIWQGHFPNENSQGDGFNGTAPVGSFKRGGYGLYDMSGNVWEWCADWYRPDYYVASERKNPSGPESSFDPQEPDQPKRVQRGGSYLCSDSYCLRYVPGARGKGEPKSAASHIGFRCARSAER